MTEAIIAIIGAGALVAVAFLLGKTDEKKDQAERTAKIARKQAAVKRPRTKRELISRLKKKV